MSEQKKPRDLYLCKWCERFSYEYSQNGYCQKCFEAKLEKYIEHSALVDLQAKYDSLKARADKLRDLMLKAEGELKFIGRTGVLTREAIQEYDQRGEDE